MVLVVSAIHYFLVVFEHEIKAREAPAWLKRNS